MAFRNVPTDLNSAIQQRCEKLRRPRLSLLFQRGEKSFGIFLVLKGTVHLDFGVDGSSPLNKSYGPGALVGLPATLAGRNYCMTATVTDDAELGFLSVEALKALLREQPALCLQLLDILGAKMAQVDQLRKAMQNKESVPAPEVGLA